MITRSFMRNPVVITQHDPLLDTLSPVDSSSAGILGLLVSGFVKQGGNAGARTLSTWEGYDVFVAGTGLTVGLDGQLESGTITAVTLLTTSGATILASLGNGLPGGLNLSVAELTAAFRDPEKLDALVASWDITYSAPLPETPGPLGPGVVFEGARGADTITGSRDHDTLRGGAGDDWIEGGTGDDLLRGDRTDFLGSDAPSGQDRLYGGKGGDWLFGDAGADSLYGGDGADDLSGGEWGGQWGETEGDLLDGGAGDDRFYGEGGDDTYLGGAGRDKLTFIDGPGATLVTLDLRDAVLTGFGTDRIEGIEIVQGLLEGVNVLRGSSAREAFVGGWMADTLSGREGADRLWGDWGDDRLSGGDGNDTLGGDAGVDLLAGGAGRDAFYLNDAAGDRLADFDAAEDDIWLALGLPGLSGPPGALREALFKDLSLERADANDRVLYDPDRGRLFLDANGSEEGQRLLLARLDEGTALSAADIAIRPLWDRDDFMV